MGVRGRFYAPVIQPEPGGEAAGTVCIWSHDWQGRTISEIGWMVLPGFQGRGLATSAVTAVVERTRSDGRWGEIHAFPGATNGPSNRICEKTGFADLGPLEYEYAGRILRCRHWAWSPPVRE